MSGTISVVPSQEQQREGDRPKLFLVVAITSRRRVNVHALEKSCFTSFRAELEELFEQTRSLARSIVAAAASL